jgi:hypothetical protein
METMMSSSNAAKPRKIRSNPICQKAWRSMRILKQWSIPAVVCTIEGATINGVAKFVASLERHGMVEKIPGYVKGRVGEYQLYRIYQKVADAPNYPQICPICDQVISAKVCDPSIKERYKETEREGEKQRKVQEKKESMRAEFAAMPELTLAEIEEIEREMNPKKERHPAPVPALLASDYPTEGWHIMPDQLKHRLSGGIRDAN